MLRLTSKFSSPPLVTIWPQHSVYLIKNKTSSLFLKYYISTTVDALLELSKVPDSKPKTKQLGGPTNGGKED